MKIKSRKILNHARGQQCTLRFVGVCNYNRETVVAAHIRDKYKGMGNKASDISIVFACSDCHRFLDEQKHKHTIETYQAIISGMQETLGILIKNGLVVVK